ncbi:putative iron-regulated membrane protein [Actinokineospora spheciospongiae]|uniref:Putative iron-regulated membrane protein n=1 Tax=Actinokineospora spheciospongiae TaxID=909613 RepID=W7IWC6_9PSEU|nr:putative iron-regulated membrane protein [Actinokineospora spheciospongiae]PWW53712.1 putative iron-regulated membrane protein [Actinokineospora spheciospongiae]
MNAPTSRLGVALSSPPAAPTRRAAARPRLSPVLQIVARRLHFVAGIVVAPFLAALCLTGLVYVFSPQIHDSLYRSDLHVHHVGEVRRPLAEQVRAALTAHPEATLKAVLTPPADDRTTRVVLAVPGPDGIEDRTVFVDPYTRLINGELTTVENRLPANTWLRQFHGNLHLGAPGRLYAELAASWVPLIAVGGLVLWLARTRRKRTRREVLLPSVRDKMGWTRLRAIHGAAGLWLAVGLVLLAGTGLTMTRFAGGRADSTIDPGRLRAPVLAAAPVPVPAGAQPIDIDRAVVAAKAAGLSGELAVTPPSGSGTPFTVTEISDGLPIHRGAVAIDPYTEGVTEHLDWSDYSPVAKLSTLATQFHTGTLFGLANQIALALLAAATFALLALGYRMWWIHNPYRRRWESLPRPVWRQLAGGPLVVVLLGVAALAWVLPAVGASLLVFLAVDALVSRFKRRKAGQPAVRPPAS